MAAETRNRGAWEGLGGPISVGRPNLNSIDPTLDDCCRREEETIRRSVALRRTLQRLDIVEEKERRRRNLVTTPAFQGCRCCYDPNSDGGEYRALIELRQKRQQEQLECLTSTDDNNTKAICGVTTTDEEKASEVDEFDYLLDEDLPEQSEELKALEDARRAELEMELLDRETAREHGYGVLRQMHPARVLKAAGLATGTRDPPSAVVLHLVDPESLGSASLDLILEKLSRTDARGTIFLRSGGRSTLLMNVSIAEKSFPNLRPDSDLPTLIAIRDGVVISVCPQLQGLRDYEGMAVESAIYDWLHRSNLLLPTPPARDALCRLRPEEEALLEFRLATNSRELEQHFDCGLEGCRKTFAHEHIGVKTEQQTGLVVSEDDVIGVSAE